MLIFFLSAWTLSQVSCFCTLLSLAHRIGFLSHSVWAELDGNLSDRWEAIKCSCPFLKKWKETIQQRYSQRPKSRTAAALRTCRYSQRHQESERLKRLGNNSRQPLIFPTCEKSLDPKAILFLFALYFYISHYFWKTLMQPEPPANCLAMA